MWHSCWNYKNSISLFLCEISINKNLNLLNYASKMIPKSDMMWTQTTHQKSTGRMTSEVSCQGTKIKQMFILWQLRNSLSIKTRSYMFLLILNRHLIASVKRIILHLGTLQYPRKLQAITPDLSIWKAQWKLTVHSTFFFLLRHVFLLCQAYFMSRPEKTI